jgi:predicted ATP-binding protein involved in virulence
MRIDQLTIKNLRLFGNDPQTIVFDAQKQITVLLGDNGAGKTSLLDACTVLLSQFFEHFPNVSKKDFRPDDVRNETNERKADYLHCGIRVTASEHEHPIDNHLLDEAEIIEVVMNRKGNQSQIPDSLLKPIKDYSLMVKSIIDEGGTVALPVLAYYGTERGRIDVPERRRDFNDIFPRWYSYQDALEPSTNFKRFFTWFERNEDLERRERERLWDRNYESHTLKAVRRALEQFFEKERLVKPRVETSPLRFVMDDLSDQEHPLEKRIDRMSDGYRISIAMVADIAARMAEANPSEEVSGLADPLESHGIVFIDEIDLHLHPKLQREVLRRLTQIFPNVQFIVSTHSPNVILGALDLVQVVKLNHGEIDTQVNTAEYENYDVSLVLLSDLFALENVRNNEYLDASRRYEELLLLPEMSNDERREFDDLAVKLERYTSHDVEIIKSTIRQITER